MVAELARRLVAVDVDEKLRGAGLTDVGRVRAVNEDRYHVDSARGIFFVVDGVGGHAAGGRAADIAVRVIRQRLERQTGGVIERIREAITAANNEIFHEARQRPEFNGMACVLTVAVIGAGRLAIGHVGDTRLYLFHQGDVRKLTPDHSPVGEREDARELSEFEAMRHPRRHEVFRDVGSTVRQLSDPDFVHTAEVALPADAALLLCSDGLTDLVPLDAIHRIVDHHAGAPDRIVRALVDAANDAGGRDNVTAVYVEGGRYQAAGPRTGSKPLPDRPTHARRWRPGVWVVAAILAALAGTGVWAWQTGWIQRPDVVGSVVPQLPGAIVVRSGESIADALSRADAGYAIVVEPGEYCERLTLKNNVRLLSRVPRAAIICLPFGTPSDEPAIVAVGVSGAELSGFRITGDDQTPLGVGVVTRDANVRLMDLEISGATTAAVLFGAGEGAMLVGSTIRDNPGSAIALEPDAAPRVSHNSFLRNGTASGAAPSMVFEAGARPVVEGNVFHGVDVRIFAPLATEERDTLLSTNTFVSSPAAPSGAAGRNR